MCSAEVIVFNWLTCQLVAGVESFYAASANVVVEAINILAVLSNDVPKYDIKSYEIQKISLSWSMSIINRKWYLNYMIGNIITSLNA